MWSEAAIEAAIAAYNKTPGAWLDEMTCEEDFRAGMRAALDAAAAVDGDERWNEAIGAAAQIIDAQVRWHEKAVELAEKIINAVEARVHRECANWLRLKADAIRSLRKPEANTMTTYPVPTKPGYYWAKHRTDIRADPWIIVSAYLWFGRLRVASGVETNLDPCDFTFGPEVTKPEGLE